MKKYGVLLFDADDTLLDFSSAERCAASALLSGCGAVVSEEMIERYSAHNLSMWKKLERGQIEREQLSYLRFKSFFEKEHIDFDPQRASELYYVHLSQQHRLIDGAEEILEYFHKDKAIYIVTNGTACVQKSRLAASGIEKYVDGVFISEHLGAVKPKKEFFDAVFASIPYKKEECLLIGDSISADIRGGCDYGIDTCYFSPKGEVCDIATYTISSLECLKEIVG